MQKRQSSLYISAGWCRKGHLARKTLRSKNDPFVIQRFAWHWWLVGFIKSCGREFWRPSLKLFKICLFAYVLTALSAQIGYIAIQEP